LLFLALAVCYSGLAQVKSTSKATRTIFAYGGNFTKPFMRYVIALTKKENPRICFLPTAAADNVNGILA